MVIYATVSFFKKEFVAELSDGRRVGQPDFRKMAEALFCAGVLADDVSFEWKAGQRMITAGQKVALVCGSASLGARAARPVVTAA